MTFTVRVKEELASLDIDRLSKRAQLAAFLRYDAKITKEKILFTLENASVARCIYKCMKEIFGISPNIIIRNQKRFRIKQIYILEIKEKIDFILESLGIWKNGKKIMPNLDELESPEEKSAFLRGVFLSTGSINDPSTSGYHLEFVFLEKKDAIFIAKVLKSIDFDAKVLKRANRYMTYLKSSENISDMLRLLGSTQGLFYFEDIRIYKDHKNMVNRLNNCEIANQEKTTQTGLNQLETIHYLKEKNLISLLDEKTQIVLEYREKYPESSYNELAEIISLETDYKIGKSGINHHFIKMRELMNKDKNRKS